MFCKKCGTKLDDGSLFCGKCGTKQDVKEPPVAAEPSPQPSPPQESKLQSESPVAVTFCGKCGTKIIDGSAFCPSCGAAVTANASTTSQPNNPTAPPEAKQFKFDEPKYLLGIPIRGTNYKTIYTTIEIENGTIQIQQWNGGLMVDNTPNEFSIRPQDISLIQMETLWDWKYIILVILQIAVTLASDELFYKGIFGIMAVWNVLFGIKRKEVHLYYQNSQLLIPDSGSATGSIRELIALLKNLNPTIRIYGFEEK